MSDIDTEADRLSARLGDRVNQHRKDHARSRMIDVAESLHASLSTMNELGDVIDGRIATQTDGCPYGEVRDGLEALCTIIWGDNGPLILADTYNCGSTLRQSAMFFAKRDAERREATS